MLKHQEAAPTEAPSQNGQLNAPPNGDPPRPRIATFSALQYRDYRLLWIGTLFASAGQWIQQVSLGWLTYEVTGSPFLLGVVNGVRSVPLAMFAPVAGVAADRMDRKQLMLATQVVMLVGTGIFATVIAAGQAALWNILLFAFVSGMGWAFNMPVRQSVVPSLVPKDGLMNAVALTSAGFNITGIIGPSIAGVLIVVIGTAGNFYVQCVAYAAVSLLIWFMRVPELERNGLQTSVLSQLREGISYVLSQPTHRMLVALALIPSVLVMSYIGLLPVFAEDVLHVGPQGFGLMVSAPGLGALTGTLSLASMGNIRYKGRVLIGALLGMSITLILLGLSQSFLLSLIVLVFAGAAQMSYMTTNTTLLQAATPPEFRGRVMGIYMITMGLQPFGSFLAGAMADIWSAPIAVVVLGTAALAFSLYVLLRVPLLRNL